MNGVVVSSSLVLRIGCVLALGCGGPQGSPDLPAGSESAQQGAHASGATDFSAEVMEIARLERAVFEDTKRLHNEQLSELFTRWVRARGDTVSAEAVTEFSRLLRDHGLTTFDDFLLAETTPVREVVDPVSGDVLPVMGALGTDVINPWLAAVEVVEGKPLDQQPNYQLACDALREHIDFALIGERDPNLSLEQLPEGLRANARWAYQRLNPTNKFDGGFDHGLYYATIREAVKKLFREDYPRAKPTMADVVVPEADGGFGIRSCLLCHDRNHTGVYKRLLGQHLHLAQKATVLASAGKQRHSEAKVVKEEAEVFLRAAQIVHRTYPDKIDAKAVRRSLTTASERDTDRLKPGYFDFADTLEELGCLRCHGADGGPDDRDPKKFNAYTLHRSAYYKGQNIKALISVIDFANVESSKLLQKATGAVNHRGPTLDPGQAGQLTAALRRWLAGKDR